MGDKKVSIPKKNITLSTFPIIVLTCFFILSGAGNMTAHADETIPQSFELIWQDSYKSASDIEKEWNDFANQSHRRWYEFKNSIEKKWDTLIYSTRKDWVSYDQNNDTRSSVDFEKGEIKVETLVSTGLKDKFEMVKSRLYEQLKNILTKAVKKDESVLKDQIKIEGGRVLSEDNLDIVFAREIVPKIQKEPAVIKSKDGIPRQKYRVSIKMVPEHLDIRAAKYIKEVNDFSSRFSLDPSLVMAMIHTESYFNPLAVSGKGAVGLMQIVPKWAGKEAYGYLYGEQFDIEPDYLFSPGINLELGTAYLHLLQTRYFSHVNDPQKIRHLAICAYNWGPTALNRQIVSKYNIKQMDSAKLYNILTARTPKETSQYLEKVLKREKLYRTYFEKQEG